MGRSVERRPLAARVALIRIVFGLIWAVDAWLKWQPDFAAGFRIRSSKEPGIRRRS